MRRYANLAATMVLGGLWHGASWSFVIWGTLHGIYLMVIHVFRALCGQRLCEQLGHSRLFDLFGWALTMLSVTVAWIFFRAETWPGALRMLQGLMGARPADGVHPLLWNAGLSSSAGVVWCGVLAALAFLAPNSNRIGATIHGHTRSSRFLRGAIGSLGAATALLLVLLNISRDSVSAFIYFNF